MGFSTLVKKLDKNKRDIKLLVLGLDNAGKSTVLNSILDKDVYKVEPTLGFNIKTINLGIHLIHIWDIGGQDCIRKFWRNYYEDTDGIIWVIDCMDLDRIEECKQLILEDRDISSMPLLILLNKIDLNPNIDVEQAVKSFELENKCRRVLVLPCSAIKGTNIKNGFQWIVKQLSEE
jgi:ADP-ribosylation factor-like protein 2